MELRPDETDLIGQWVERGGRVTADAVASRIDELVANSLTRLATSPDGWSVLYRDRRDGRFWRLWYPQGEMHGGGPPRLTCLTSEAARREFGLPERSDG